MKPADINKNLKMYILHVSFIYLSVSITRTLRRIRPVENGDSVPVEKLAVMTSGGKDRGEEVKMTTNPPQVLRVYLQNQIINHPIIGF